MGMTKIRDTTVRQPTKQGAQAWGFNMQSNLHRSTSRSRDPRGLARFGKVTVAVRAILSEASSVSCTIVEPVAKCSMQMWQEILLVARGVWWLRSKCQDEPVRSGVLSENMRDLIRKCGSCDGRRQD